MTDAKVVAMMCKIQGYSSFKDNIHINLSRFSRGPLSPMNNDMVNSAGLAKFIREFNKFSMINPQTDFCRIVHSQTNTDECTFIGQYVANIKKLELCQPFVTFTVSIFTEKSDTTDYYRMHSLLGYDFGKALKLFFKIPKNKVCSLEQIFKEFAMPKYKLITMIDLHERIFISNMKSFIQSQAENITNE